MAAGTGEKITVQCACGAKLKAPASAVGRKARCPKCGATLTVAPPPAEADGLDALYDLAGDAKAAAQSAPAEQVAVLCPACRTRMEAGAVLCTHCGYDTRTGKALQTSTTTAEPTVIRPAPTGTAFPPPLRTSVQTQADSTTGAGDGGNLIKGALISAAFAFVGALVWYFIAKATEREIGWIAWGVGLAAGFGMMIGYNGTSVKSGTVAATMAVAGIIVGKFMVFTWVVIPMVVPMLSGLLDKELEKISPEDRLHVHVLNQQLEKKGIDPDDATDAQSEAADKEAEAIIAKMDAKTKKAEIDKATAAMKSQGEAVVATEMNRSKLFFETMFSPVDIIFIVLAVGSAFKVATFGNEVQND